MEHHDNTRPASTGSYSLSKEGHISYFPIEASAFLKPSIALLIHEKLDGEVVLALDIKMDPLLEEV